MRADNSQRIIDSLQLENSPRKPSPPTGTGYKCSYTLCPHNHSLTQILDDYAEDDDSLAPEQPPQLYIPDWNAFNAGANVAAAASNAVRGALGNPCCGGGGGGMGEL